jgi:putative glutamine amidotransferase
MIRIGVASAFMYPDLNRPTFGGKSLCFIEKDMANYISREGVQPMLIPDLIDVDQMKMFLGQMDAFVLQGGNDVAPETYGDKPINDGAWKGDIYRDEFELEILDYAIKNDKPVFGICRGAQLMNVYFGGTLYQDIQTQNPTAIKHRDAVAYDQLTHDANIKPNTFMSKLIGADKVYINSIHHQGIKDLGKNVEALASCADDGITEAIQWTGVEEGKVMGVQWHPEFFYNCNTPLFDTDILFKHFLSSIR